MPQKKEHKLISNWILLACAIVLIIGLGYLTWYVMSQDEITITPVATTTNSNSNTNSATADWKNFSESGYNFTFMYPKDWTIVSKTNTDRNGIKYQTVKINTPNNLILNIHNPILETGFEDSTAINKKSITSQSGIFGRTVLKPNSNNGLYFYTAIKNSETTEFSESADFILNSQSSINSELVNTLDNIVETFQFTK